MRMFNFGAMHTALEDLSRAIARKKLPHTHTDGSICGARHGRGLQQRAERLRQWKARCAALACLTALPRWPLRCWHAGAAARPPLQPCRSVQSSHMMCFFLDCLFKTPTAAKPLRCARPAWGKTSATKAFAAVKGRFKARIDGFLCAQGGIGDAVLHLLKLAGQGAAHPAVCELSPAGLTSLLQVTLTSLLFACVSYLWWQQGMQGRVALVPLLACMTFKSRYRLVSCLHCVTLCVCWVGLPITLPITPSSIQEGGRSGGYEPGMHVKDFRQWSLCVVQGLVL